MWRYALTPNYNFLLAVNYNHYRAKENNHRLLLAAAG